MFAATAKRQPPEALRRPHVTATPMVTGPGGKRGQLMAAGSPELRIGASFSFVRVTDSQSYERYAGAVAPVRSKELIEMMEIIKERVERARKEVKEVKEVRKRSPSNPKTLNRNADHLGPSDRG